MLTRDLFEPLGCFVFNEYFDEYLDLINLNLKNEYQVHCTQYHHVIPNSYCKELGIIQVYPKCVLKFHDHVLAHYYLSLCTNNTTLIYYNLCAVNYMTNNKLLKKSISKEWLIQNLPKLQDQYEKIRRDILNCMDIAEIKERHDDIMRSDSVRNRISQTMKYKCEVGELFTEDHRKNLSQSMTGKVHLYRDNENLVCNASEVDYYLSLGYQKGQINVGTSGRTKMNNGSEIKFVKNEEVETYLKLGYVIGGLPYTLESRKKMSKAHKGQSPSNKGTRLMNNGLVKVYVRKDQIEDYLAKGFTFGNLKGGDNK